jgi:hypothetical protein
MKSKNLELGAHINFNLQEVITFFVKLNKTK